MNKETALHVLGLSAKASLEQAKNAYRQLAKKHHPDVIEKKSNPAPQVESRMKDINLAFRFLVPYLKSESTIEKIDKNKPFREKKPAEPAESAGFTHSKQNTHNTIFSVLTSFFARAVSGLGQKQRPGNKSRSHPQKKQSAPGHKTDKMKFDDVLNTFSANRVKRNSLTGVKTKSINGGKSKHIKAKSNLHPDRQAPSPYSRYRQYMALKKKYQPISRYRSKGMKIERVTKIDPIRPVDPIAKG